MQHELGIFQQILEAIEATLRAGAVPLRAQLVFWFGLFLWLEALRVCWAFLYNGRVLPGLVSTLVKGCLLWWALYHFPDLLEGAQRSFIRLGLLAGGDRLAVAQFLDPGAYLHMGMQVMRHLAVKAGTSSGLFSWAGETLAYIFLWLAFMASFAVMAVNVLIWQVEMLVAGVMLLTLLPTLAFRSTAWIGQGALSYVVNKAFRFGVGALLASLTFPLLERLTITTPMTLQRVVVSVIGGWVFALLFWQVNKLASGFLAGMPQLSAGTVASAAVGSAITVGAVGAGAVSAGAGAASSVLHAGRAGLLAGQSLLGGARTAGTAAQVANAGKQGPPLLARMESYAGTSRRVAQGHAQRSLRQFVDLTRYVGHDHAGLGVRR